MRLEKILSDCLPSDDRFEVLHLQSVPTENYPIVTKKLGQDNELITVKTQHFFTLFQNSKTVFGLEIYVYITLIKKAKLDTNNDVLDAERLIFISKADTTGYNNKRINIKLITKSIIHYLLSIDPNYYLQKVKPLKRNYVGKFSNYISKSTSTVKALKLLSKRKSAHQKQLYPPNDLFLHLKCEQNIVTKICLFTRPADQYLFADSSKNAKKHVLTGEGLLLWWISIMDDLLIEEYESGTEAKLNIPGEENVRIRKYFRNLKYSSWNIGDIFGGSANSLAVFNIPLFPDDPKSRFLHQLVEENRIYKTDMETFWIELQERQEFKAGITVSVIGISGHLRSISKNIPMDGEIIKTPSKSSFKHLKSYITGEEFDTEEGALESYSNIKEYVVSRMHKDLLTVSGTYQFKPKIKPSVQKFTITTLQPRRAK
ncbi:hypothetical protein TPHA_0N00750 [Tetrapisispora phaffii CBS 4417]|uniref:histone acetyltransferase n=1 Tax=Tetrapisispora phaffii (strain ATCC 24235 / CBS 4417 / NBRC 1672 / NRRL Y-8282 / UCD 70-5) TaxID=1071381 RepID=G8C128_TETPH|nr:hypothetical protein TPHA_0N00750 [Tetrapisispora phaffii CBS 4417]CCE65856.1 hypothetical protein TPHA_0N00750 [Tetrapisispora phaffii CBS 4417]